MVWIVTKWSCDRNKWLPCTNNISGRFYIFHQIKTQDHRYETWFANDHYQISKWRHRIWSVIIYGYFSWYWGLFAWQNMVHWSFILCPYFALIIYISTQQERIEISNKNLRWDSLRKNHELPNTLGLNYVHRENV